VTRNSAEATPPTGASSPAAASTSTTGGTVTVEDSAIVGNRVSLANSIPHPYPHRTGSRTRPTRWAADLPHPGSTATIRHSWLDGNAVTVAAPLGEPFRRSRRPLRVWRRLTVADSAISGKG
jgi:hypothetical protein